MDQESIREYCLSLPDATENVQWGNDLVFKIGGKMFAVVVLDNSYPHVMSFKCTPEEFAEYVEHEGIDPAAYVARYHWIALQRFDVLPKSELKRLIKDSYEMVKAKLPKKVRDQLGQFPLTETKSKSSKKVR